jgi:hypothetical protein
MRVDERDARDIAATTAHRAYWSGVLEAGGKNLAAIMAALGFACAAEAIKCRDAGDQAAQAAWIADYRRLGELSAEWERERFLRATRGGA